MPSTLRLLLGAALVALSLLVLHGPRLAAEPPAPAAAPPAASPTAGALVNGDLSAWGDGLPAGWSASIGATNGEGDLSEVAPGPEGGVRLAGGAETKRWRLLAQPLDVPAGTVLRLTAEARALGLRQEKGQFPNAYVALALWSAEGAFAGLTSERQLREAWLSVDLALRVPEGVRAGPALFLSMSGALEVRGVRCEPVPPAGAYDLLVAHVARHYSFLALKGPGLPGGSWTAHAQALRARALAAADEEALVAVLKDLLAPLQDLHVTIRRPEGQIVPTWIPATRFNVDGKTLKRALGELTPAGRAGFVANLEGDLGYLAVTTLQGLDADHAKLRLLLRGLCEKQGLVIDLRGNGGGDETRAQALVGLLTDEPRPYARRRVRSGPLPGDLSAPEEAVLRPDGGGRAYRGPIVVLLGPGCISSGEGMAQMLDALPNARSVGQPTFGASGSPLPVPLPGGLDVWFSRWVNEQMDGTALEGRGVQPDVVVAHEGEGDPTLAAGLAELRRMLAERGTADAPR